MKQRGILTAQHLIHPDKGAWLGVSDTLEQYSLPNSQFLGMAQSLHFCRSRLRDLSKEAFDEILQKSSRAHGISCLYTLLRRPLANITYKKIFKKWEKGT